MQGVEEIVAMRPSLTSPDVRTLASINVVE